MKNLTTFILCLMTINAMAQTNDIKRAFEIKNDSLKTNVLAYQEFPNKDRIFLYYETISRNSFIQYENNLGELVYKKSAANVANPAGNHIINFANALNGTVFFVNWSYGTFVLISSTNDGGTTWKHKDFDLSSSYVKPVIHRMNEDVVFFYFTENSVYNFEQNIYITFDGGMNWETKHLNPPQNKKVANGTMKVDFDKKGKITATCNYTDNENKKIVTQKFISKDFGKTFK